MAREEGGLSEGARFANELDKLFRDGTFKQVMASTPFQAETPGEDELLKKRLDGHILAFCQDLSPAAATQTERRAAANYVREYFETWKLTRVEYWKRRSAPEPEIGALQGLTLKRVAEYASEQFKEASHDAATLEPGSVAQHLARQASDYWSIMEEIITPAADPDHQ